VEVEQPIDASTSIENSAIEDAATPEVTEIPAPVDVPVDVDASDEDPAPINPPAAVSPLTIEEPSEPAVGVPPEAEPETPADFPVEAQSVDEQPAADVAPVEAPDMIENPGYVPAPAAVPPEDAPSAQPASAQDVPPLDISASDATTDAASDSSSLTPVAQPNDAADIAPVAPPPPLDAPQPEFVRPPIADWALRKDTSQTNTVLQMYTIPFNQNSYRLGSEDLRLITNIAKIHQRTGARIRVVGHSSAIGKQKTQKQALTNFVISMQRAQAIADALVKKGVQAEMIYVEAAADNWPTGAGAKADRRAEIFLDY
jgi:outer membrane protein OmpA-like peptidoglycan-associated protein